MKKNLIGLGFVVMGLTACGGGGGGSSSSSTSGGAESNAQTVTRIIGHADKIDASENSMTINGQHYPISEKVEIELDGAPDHAEHLTLDQLTPDMALDIELNSAGDTITEIEVEADIIGVAENVTSNTLTVNGQVFQHNLSLETPITQGDTVIMTGFVDTSTQDWTVRSVSTFQAQDFVLHYGQVETVNQVYLTYLNGPLVDYSNVSDDDAARIKVGDRVEVEGASYANGEIYATDLDIEDADDNNFAANNGQIIEIEGRITEIGTNSSYVILNNNQQIINITPDTIFETDDGISYSQNDLKLGAVVEVEMMANDAEFDALEIEFED
ncbi:MAG: DUF5666 domain-containing protein [Vibrio sp.]